MTWTSFLAMSPAPQAQGGAGPQGGTGLLLQLVPFVLIMVIFYFLLIRPQQQRQKKHQLMIEQLKKGDRILTSGGLFVNVLNVMDDRIVGTIDRDETVKIEIAKGYVASVVEKS
jgi:preprotein translocase subunit YajC